MKFSIAALLFTSAVFFDLSSAFPAVTSPPGDGAPPLGDAKAKAADESKSPKPEDNKLLTSSLENKPKDAAHPEDKDAKNKLELGSKPSPNGESKPAADLSLDEQNKDPLHLVSKPSPNEEPKPTAGSPDNKPQDAASSLDKQTKDPLNLASKPSPTGEPKPAAGSPDNKPQEAIPSLDKQTKDLLHLGSKLSSTEEPKPAAGSPDNKPQDAASPLDKQAKDKLEHPEKSPMEENADKSKHPNLPESQKGDLPKGQDLAAKDDKKADGLNAQKTDVSKIPMIDLTETKKADGPPPKA